MVNRRQLLRALVVAGVAETTLVSISLWMIYEGGIHPGGAFFAVLHLPSSLLFGYIAAGLGTSSLFVEVLFMIFTIVSQFLLFVLTVYWIQRLLSTDCVKNT